MDRPLEDVWLVYDGECPLCRTGADRFQTGNASGALHVIDQRTQETHPMVEEIRQKRLNLDKGMVLKYEGRLYQGADALYLMSRINADPSYIVRISRILFRHRFMVALCYPFLRLARNLLLKWKGVPTFTELERKR